MNGIDQPLWKQLAESVIGRLAAALLAAFTAARTGSAVVARASEARDSWQRFTRAERWQWIATVLIVAVLTHFGLLALQRPSGWWWWVIPGIAGGYAVVLLALAMTAKRTGTTG